MAPPSNLKLALVPLAIMVCIAGCSKGPTPQERIRQEREARANKLDPQIEADWQNVVNGSRPAMAALNEALAMANQMERDQAAYGGTNQVGSK